MEDKILDTIKQMCDVAGIDSFDTDLKIYINTTLDELRDNSVGIAGFYLTTGEETWDEFVLDPEDLGNAKTYVYCKVKPLFDPTISGSYKETLNQQAEQCLWRLRNREGRY
ncbi:MAG: hypothetical protein KBT27_06660 [Prevotellaceae bacterium]|nr:hypothetical protein [Candidatus Faecinaster equi]